MSSALRIRPDQWTIYPHPNGRRRIQTVGHLTLEELDNGNWLVLPRHAAVKQNKRPGWRR